VYCISGLLGISFLFLPLEPVVWRVLVFMAAQAFVVSSFFLLDTYTPEVFSTDTRNFSFSFLDSVSKVKLQFIGQYQGTVVPLRSAL